MISRVSLACALLPLSAPAAIPPVCSGVSLLSFEDFLVRRDQHCVLSLVSILCFTGLSRTPPPHQVFLGVVHSYLYSSLSSGQSPGRPLLNSILFLVTPQHHCPCPAFPPSSLGYFRKSGISALGSSFSTPVPGTQQALNQCGLHGGLRI